MLTYGLLFFFFFSSRRRHTRCSRDWSSDVCSSDLLGRALRARAPPALLPWGGSEGAARPPLTMDLGGGRRGPLRMELGPDQTLIRVLGEDGPLGHLGLEFRERRVHLLGYRALLGLLLDDVLSQLSQLLDDRGRELEDLDLPFVLRLELLEADGVLRVVLGEERRVDRPRGVVEDVAEVDRQRVVGLLVEHELA